jgi:oxygen-independent coproporphyrinogen-3 oxidase
VSRQDEQDGVNTAAAPPCAGEATIALYVHIPYCLSKCPYCDFNSYAARSWPESEYAAALTSELEGFAREAPWRDASVATIFFGGGTPSLFRPATIGAILDAIARHLRLAPDVECTLEANPGTLSFDSLSGFRGAGVNRLSLGVQSFQPDLLLALGRRHSVADSRGALAAARRAGFENLSLDLIYAVPGQDQAACAADVAEAVGFAPEHVSAYNLTYEPGTPLRRELDRGGVVQAPEELEVALHQTVRCGLEAAGYARYEISNYARPGRAARHNQAYWRGIPYLGLGAGAHSFAPVGFGRRWANLRDPNRYMERVRATGNAIDGVEELSRTQALGECAWLGLREIEGLDTRRFAARFGEPLEVAFPHVTRLVSDGLLESRGSQLRLTARGLLLADSVFASFF